MVIQIDRRGGIFYIYKNYRAKGQPFDHVAQAGTGWRWGWKGDELTIYDNQKQEVAYLYFKRRFFRPSDLYFHFKANGRTVKVEPLETKRFRDHAFGFDYEGAHYEFSTHRAHHKSLFRNGIQAAAFDKQYFHFFNCDACMVFAESDVPVVLLICLSLYDQLHDGDDTAFTIDLGNILGSKPPEEGKWRPKQVAVP